MNYLYTLYGITISVPFPCPMLTASQTEIKPDVTLVLGEVPRNLTGLAMKEGPNWQATHGKFLLRCGQRAGRFLIENGELITLQRNPSAEEELLCSLLSTSVIAVLLHQRGYLVLHANVVITPHGAIAISGESGTGKSTTQAALLARGCKMLTDDVTVLCLNESGVVVALPGIPKMNLCEDTAVMFGHNIAELPRNPLLCIKVIAPVAPLDMFTEVVPIKAIYYLSFHSEKKVQAAHLAGTEKFAALQECIYGPQFPEELLGIFPLKTALISQIEIVSIKRPITGWSLEEVVEAILCG